MTNQPLLAGTSPALVCSSWASGTIVADDTSRTSEKPRRWRGFSGGGGGRHCPGVRGTPSRCLLRAFPSESDLGDRFGRSAGYVPGATPSNVSRDGRGSDRRGEPAALKPLT